MRKLFLLLLISLLATLPPIKAASALDVLFLQPPNSVPIPALSDTLGHQLIGIDPTTAPATTLFYSSPSLEGGKVVSTTNKVLIGFSVTTVTAAAWIMVFDASSIPADGAVAPKLCFSTTSAGSSSYAVNLPVTTGIVLVLSTTGCFTKTISNTAFFAVWYGG